MRGSEWPRKAQLNGFVQWASGCEELLAEWRCPGAGTIGEAFDLPAIVSFKTMMSSAECADIAGRSGTSGFPTLGVIEI